MAETIIIHDLKKSNGKIKKAQPVDRYRKALKHAKIDFIETIKTGTIYIEKIMGSYESKKHDGTYSIFTF